MNDLNKRVVVNLRQSLKLLKKDKTNLGRKKYRAVVEAIVRKSAKDHSMRKHMGLQLHSWSQASAVEVSPELQISNKMSKENEASIIDFFEVESTPHPMMKIVDAKTLVPKSVWSQTLQKTPQIFTSRNLNKSCFSNH